jgi:hypothetical protein
VTMAQGTKLPTEILSGVQGLEETVSTGGLSDFFDVQQRANFASRCRELLLAGFIPVAGSVAARHPLALPARRVSLPASGHAGPVSGGSTDQERQQVVHPLILQWAHPSHPGSADQ